jgi:hypothetical protein
MERIITEVVIIGEGGSSLSVVEQNVLNILQYFQDEGIVDATVRVAVPGGEDFTYKAHAHLNKEDEYGMGMDCCM